MSTNKRHIDTSGETNPTSDNDEPPSKRSTAIYPPVNLGPISSLEELDVKTLQFQNKKLWERIEVRRQAELELNEQIETLQAKQNATNATLSLVNRYWDQLDDNIKIILRRLQISDGEGDDNTQEDDDYKKKSFRKLLKDNEFSEIKENISGRLEFSRATICKVIEEIMEGKKNYSSFITSLNDKESTDAALKEKSESCQKENSRLNDLITTLQAEHHNFSLEKASLNDKIEELEDRIEELQETAENARWELKKARLREDRMTKRLAEFDDQLQKGNAANLERAAAASSSSDTSQKNGDKEHQAKEDKTLADSRLAELETMKSKYQECLKEVEALKRSLKNLPSDLILQSTEYKTLKSQFSVLYHEGVQMKAALDESRNLLIQSRHASQRRMEQIECDELQTQRKLRNELIQLEDSLAKVRHDYESLHAEFEQNLAANEQAGPVNREMRHLINSLQNHNRQLKGEIQRYKRKMKEMQNDLNKIQGDKLESLNSSQEDKIKAEVKNEPQDGNEEALQEANSTIKQEVKSEPVDVPEALKVKEEKINELNDKLKVELDQNKELKLLLEMYKSLTKEQREKAQIMADEKETKNQFEQLENKCKELQDKLKSLEEELDSSSKQIISKEKEIDFIKVTLNAERAKLEKYEKSQRGPDAESMRKIKVLEESIAELRKNLANTKQEEEALLSEMDVTGQAFEDMQEQNMRLLQQLREKDDANFKLMSERIKANQVHKLLQEEKNILQDQTNTLHLQVEAQNQVVRRLEEKERALIGSLKSLETELNLRTQAMDLHKRKAVELAQHAEDMKREMDLSKDKVLVLEESIDRKVEQLEEEHFKLSRLQEDGQKLRRKLEKHKKTAGLYTADEVLMEEIKEYKTKLRCPCCNVNNKDAILTKCWHVFCIKCIKTRYDTRQRKCPKCNAAFGGNDFHRIYIE